ncbi:hypothetical protein [Paenibacillus sp. GCM10027626]
MFMGVELIGSGPIDAIDGGVAFDDLTEDIVTICGEWYVRGTCTFVYTK